MKKCSDDLNWEYYFIAVRFYSLFDEKNAGDDLNHEYFLL